MNLKTHQQLFGYYTQESAYIVKQFPLHFDKMTKARYWVETKEKYGQRIMRQHYDTSTNSWVTPKNIYGSYSNIALMFLCTDPESPECGQVKCMFVDLSAIPRNQIVAFSEYYVFTDFQRKRIIDWMFMFHKIQCIPNWRNNFEIPKEPDVEGATLPKGRRTKFDTEEGAMAISPANVNMDDPSDVRNLTSEQAERYRQSYIDMFGIDPLASKSDKTASAGKNSSNSSNSSTTKSKRNTRNTRNKHNIHNIEGKPKKDIFRYCTGLLSPGGGSGPSMMKEELVHVYFPGMSLADFLTMAKQWRDDGLEEVFVPSETEDE